LMALTSLVAIKGAKTIFKPIELMGSVVRAIGEGKDQRTGKTNSDDEIGSLAIEFDKMLDLLNERKILLQNWAVDLEGTVDKRTAELKHKNAELINTISVLRKTRQKLVVAEKLAALGELTAGVAHEINNPTAVILGNLDVIIDEMGEQLEPVQNEIDLVISQIYRIKDITDNLLQYAKPGVYAGYMTDVNVNTTIKETMKLLQHLRLETDYQFDLTLDASLLININEQELQQVLINLMSNAIQALPDRDGEIAISTRDIGQSGVEIIIEDNGHGMDQEMISRIFNPFYTTKDQGEGTGLGLSISFSLVTRYGGNIDVSSNANIGTQFTVFLYCTPVMVEDEKMILKQLEEIEADTA
jgi:two-component system NtrC family sensor kinase